MLFSNARAEKCTILKNIPVFPDFTQWQLAKKDLVEISDRHLGDTILFAASVSYLGFFKHEQRLLVLQTVAEVLAAHLHATLDSDPDDPTLVEGVQCTPGFSLERHLVRSPISLRVPYARRNAQD